MGNTGFFFSKSTFHMNKAFTTGISLFNHLMLMRQILTQYGLSSRKRPPPVSDRLGLTFWVVAYGRFDCNSTRQSYQKIAPIFKLLIILASLFVFQYLLINP